MTNSDDSTKSTNYISRWSADFLHKKLTPPKKAEGICLTRQDLEEMVEAIFENTVLKVRPTT